MSSQVKRKAAEADEMIRQLAAQGNDPVSDTPAENGDEAQPEAEVIALQTEDEQTPTDIGEDATQTSDPGYSADDIAELKEEARKADARWRSLQGQIDSKDRQIEQLHLLLAKMETAPQPEAQSESQPSVGYTKDDAEAFGDDMIDLIERVARSVVSQVVDQRVQPLAQELKSVSSVTASTVQESFEAKLTKLAPLWEKLNADQRFIDWLQESPTRWDGFQAAASRRDAVGTADYFNMFAKLNGLDQPPAGDKRKQQLEKQLSPGKARSSAPTAASTPEEKIWTRSEIADLYSNKRKYSAEEFAKLEREVSRAMASDRVDYSR